MPLLELSVRNSARYLLPIRYMLFNTLMLV